MAATADPVLPHKVDSSGTCSTCSLGVKENWVECFQCKERFHGNCTGLGKAAYCTKTALTNFKGMKCDNFVFICNNCLTSKEHIEASSVKEQLAMLVTTVSDLKREFREFKTNNTTATHNASVEIISSPIAIDSNKAYLIPKTDIVDSNPTVNHTAAPSDVNNNVSIPVPSSKSFASALKKSTVCIKNNVDTPETVDMEKVRSVVTSNGIRVSKATVNEKNGDVYVELPSDEEREKLIPLLGSLQGNTVVKVNSKLPVIQLRNVCNFIDKDNFVDNVKLQNPKLGEEISKGSVFSILFTKQKTETDSAHLVVIRVSPEIRDILKEGGDRIYFGFSSYKAEDRFYVKTCNKCHQFGHYHSDCTKNSCCGYCASEEHSSGDCPVKALNDPTKFKCVNCTLIKKDPMGHSAHWHKCPALLEQQNRVKSLIPYYASKN